MTLNHQLVTLNATTPFLLTTAFAAEIEYAGNLNITVQNLDQSKHVLLGSSSITTSSYGHKLDPLSNIQLTLRPEDELYGLADTGTLSCGIIKVQH
jgi:hypothetical protein